MKKYLCFLLISLLCLTTACGNAEVPTTNESSEESAEAEEEIVTLEKALSMAVPMNCAEMISKAKDNILVAEDSYLNRYFKVTGIVTEIYSDYAKVSIPDPVSNSSLGILTIECYMNREDLLQLHKRAYINVVGRLSKMSDGLSHFVMDEAFLVDDIVEISGPIQYFYKDGQPYITVYTDLALNSLGYTSEHYVSLCEYNGGGYPTSDKTCTVLDQTFKPGDKVTVSLRMDYSYSVITATDADAMDHYLFYDNAAETISISK